MSESPCYSSNFSIVKHQCICILFFRENYLFDCDCTLCQSEADQPDETSDEFSDEEMEDE